MYFDFFSIGAITVQTCTVYVIRRLVIKSFRNNCTKLRVFVITQKLIIFRYNFCVIASFRNFAKACITTIYSQRIRILYTYVIDKKFRRKTISTKINYPRREAGVL
jgi:hypothetical protein